jgi:hypothetical protein
MVWTYEYRLSYKSNCLSCQFILKSFHFLVICWKQLYNVRSFLCRTYIISLHRLSTDQSFIQLYQTELMWGFGRYRHRSYLFYPPPPHNCLHRLSRYCYSSLLFCSPPTRPPVLFSSPPFTLPPPQLTVLFAAQLFSSPPFAQTNGHEEIIGL